MLTDAHAEPQGLLLSSRYRFAEIRYLRAESRDKPVRVETVVLFLPDVWHCEPSRLDWISLQKAYVQKLQKMLGAGGEEAEQTQASIRHLQCLHVVCVHRQPCPVAVLCVCRPSTLPGGCPVCVSVVSLARWLSCVCVGRQPCPVAVLCVCRPSALPGGCPVCVSAVSLARWLSGVCVGRQPCPVAVRCPALSVIGRNTSAAVVMTTAVGSTTFCCCVRMETGVA